MAVMGPACWAGSSWESEEGTMRTDGMSTLTGRVTLSTWMSPSNSISTDFSPAALRRRGTSRVQEKFGSGRSGSTPCTMATTVPSSSVNSVAFFM